MSQTLKFKMVIHLACLMAIVGFSLLPPSSAEGASVTLAWNAGGSNPEGYRVFARRSARSYDYSRPIWQGANPGCTIINLEDQTEYYFVVRAFSGDVESANSNEIRYVTPASTPTPTAATPTISPSGGTFSGSVQVSLACATSGATIYYTTNGRTPSTGSTRYTGPFTLSSSATVRAMATALNHTNSAVASATFTRSAATTPTAATPTISPYGGTFSGSVQVSLACATSGATIYYTTDGRTPSTGSTRYTGPFTLSSSATVRAMATALNHTNSAVASATFTRRTPSDPAPTPPPPPPGDATRILLEAENYDANTDQGEHAWDEVTHLGVSAMEAVPDSGARIARNYVENSPYLSFDVNFAKTGTYYIWLRGFCTRWDNSAHIGLNGSAVRSAMNISLPVKKDWVWSGTRANGNRATVTVKKTGSQTIEVYMREDGLILDKIILTTSAGYTPSD